MKNVHHKCCEPKLTFSNYFFSQTKSAKPKDIHFTMLKNINMETG